jgi:hypothetical protein
MPIQIIPKEAAKLPLWQNILFYLSMAVVLATLLSYGIFTQLTKNSETILKEKEKLFEANKTPETLSLEQGILNYKNKIDAFAVLLSNHKLSSQFFSFLERITHPRVFYAEMTLDVKNNKVTFLGQTESFRTLGQQMSVLRNEEMVTAAQLSDININKEGRVEFSLVISLNPKVFSP